MIIVCKGIKRQGNIEKYKQDVSVCETQMPQIMAYSKDGKGHKDKYFDTSRKILSIQMLICNMKAQCLCAHRQITLLLECVLTMS